MCADTRPPHLHSSEPEQEQSTKNRLVTRSDPEIVEARVLSEKRGHFLHEGRILCCRTEFDHQTTGLSEDAVVACGHVVGLASVDGLGGTIGVSDGPRTLDQVAPVRYGA